MKRAAGAALVLAVWGYLPGQGLTPHRISLFQQVLQVDSTQSGLQSNVVTEIRIQGDSLVWLGTGRGLSVMRDTLSLRSFYTASRLTPGQSSLVLPEGGVSAIGTGGEDTLLVAVAVTRDGVTTGGGLAFTANSQDTTGVRWLYYSQPVDSAGDSTLSWGGVSLKALPITVPQQNVTYDIAVGKDYFWTASWAGGLRRLSRWSPGSSWERVPLPLDGQPEMSCGEEVSGYELNPRDPPDGNHNHKGFSVLAYGDTVWVGTANGINRGIVSPTGCVEWMHYSFPLSGITGNWVVGLARQQWGGIRRIWAVTLSTDPAEENGVSYTPDDGRTWYAVAGLRGERGYNIFALDSLVYVATENGLWTSGDGVNFSLFEPAVDPERDDQILDDDVYAVVHDTRPYYGDVLWIGTGDGMARNLDPGNSSTGLESTWRIERADVDPGEVYAYPNPFSPYVNNLLEGDGYVRFHTRVRRSRLVRVSIYNFAMETVRTFDYHRGEGEGTLKWDGRDNRGNLVANGTYFCNLFYDNENHWLKVVVLK
ncbi:MAG: FlgD immunoglobulin-like domain containing protein [Fidelibacterota bacterium]